MAKKRYGIVLHFQDGTTWGPEIHNATVNAEEAAYMLNHYQSSDDMEIESQKTGEVRQVSDIKSIELVF